MFGFKVIGFIKVRRHARAISIIDTPRLAFLTEQQQKKRWGKGMNIVFQLQFQKLPFPVLNLLFPGM